MRHNFWPPHIVKDRDRVERIGANLAILELRNHHGQETLLSTNRSNPFAQTCRSPLRFSLQSRGGPYICGNWNWKRGVPQVAVGICNFSFTQHQRMIGGLRFNPIIFRHCRSGFDWASLVTVSGISSCASVSTHPAAA
jgi:hypothetical protein